MDSVAKILTIVIVLVLNISTSVAIPLYSGTTTGNFDSPVLIGYTINPDGISQSYWDNTSTAVVSGEGTNSFSWGAWPGGGYTIDSSSLSFASTTFANVRPFLPGTDGDIFEIGTLTYVNGSSLFSTVAFGITLTLDAIIGAAGDVTPTAIQLGLIQTSGSVAGTRADDADFITFSVDGVDIGTSFHIFERETASVTLFGRIVGDPVLEFVDITLVPGETGGFLQGNPIPEPITLTMMGIGLAGIGYRRHRSKIAA